MTTMARHKTKAGGHLYAEADAHLDGIAVWRETDAGEDGLSILVTLNADGRLAAFACRSGHIEAPLARVDK